MCGIAGSINFQLNLPVLTRDLLHRGPDEQTTFTEDSVILHHHRLAILDIAGGKQPMHFEHLTIIFNGEIYNHLDVRTKYGFTCHTNSDTETILRAYDKLGAKCLDDFDGMFAFVIYDRKKKELFLARDRAGKKPLYYYSDGNRFVFASELGALSNQLSLQVNESHLEQYVRMGYFYKSATPYRNVWELPAGSYAYVSTQKPEIKVERWWNIHSFYRQRSSDDLNNALDTIEQLVHRAVKR